MTVGEYYTVDEAQALFRQANETYVGDGPARAAELYRRLISHGWEGSDVQFNLGTAELSAGRLGPAILALERAEREGGRSDDVGAQLVLARAKQLDKVVGAIEDPFVERLAWSVPVSTSSLVFLVAWWLLISAWVAGRLVRNRFRSLLGAVIAVGAMIAVASGLLLGLQFWAHESVHEAVIQVEKLPAREAPLDRGKISFEMHAGLKVQILDEEGPFVKVQLPNGLTGWASRSGLEDI